MSLIYFPSKIPILSISSGVYEGAKRGSQGTSLLIPDDICFLQLKVVHWIHPLSKKKTYTRERDSTPLPCVDQYILSNGIVDT